MPAHHDERWWAVYSQAIGALCMGRLVRYGNIPEAETIVAAAHALAEEAVRFEAEGPSKKKEADK